MYDLPEDSIEFQTINKIIEYSEPKIKQAYITGKTILMNAANDISVFNIGLLPLYKQEGYLIVRSNEYLILYEYEYSGIIISNIDNITFNEIYRFNISASNTFENIKQYIIKNFNKFSNPAVYAADYSKNYPYESLLLPIIKLKMNIAINTNI